MKLGSIKIPRNFHLTLEPEKPFKQSVKEKRRKNTLANKKMLLDLAKSPEISKIQNT